MITAQIPHIEIMTATEVADLFGVHEATVRRWCRTQELPRHKLGRSIRFRRDEVLAWFARRADGNS